MTSEFRVPAPLQNTIDNLAFLAATDDGEKLYFKERLHINTTDWTARMRRYYYNETLESQKKIIKEIIDLGLDSLKSYRNNVHYDRLVSGFCKAKDGLCNLRNTYLKEGREVQDLDNYIYVMENQIKALDKTNAESKSNQGIATIEVSNYKDLTNQDTIICDKNNNSIITEQPRESQLPLVNNYDIQDTGDNNEVNNGDCILDMSSVMPQESSNRRGKLKNAKSISISNRPELEKYMNRNK